MFSEKDELCPMCPKVGKQHFNKTVIVGLSSWEVCRLLNILENKYCEIKCKNYRSKKEMEKDIKL